MENNGEAQGTETAKSSSLGRKWLPVLDRPIVIWFLSSVVVTGLGWSIKKSISFAEELRKERRATKEMYQEVRYRLHVFRDRRIPGFIRDTKIRSTNTGWPLSYTAPISPPPPQSDDDSALYPKLSGRTLESLLVEILNCSENPAERGHALRKLRDKLDALRSVHPKGRTEGGLEISPKRLERKSRSLTLDILRLLKGFAGECEAEVGILASEES